MAETPLLILIATTLLAALSVSSAFALSDSPFIVAHKKAILTKLRPSSERVSVTIDIYNRGPATAHDLRLTDETWSLDVFDVINGNTSKSWKTVDGGSHVSHSFELVSKVKTVYYGAPARITFRPPLNHRIQEAYSTPILPLHILADKVTVDKLQLAKKMLAKYGSQISVILLVAAFVHIIFSPSNSNAGNASKKKH